MKIKIFTNIPTPNNLDFFNDLGMNCDLDVVYYCKIESNRKWSLELNSDNYSHKVLNPPFISTFLKKLPKRSQFLTLDTTISSMSLYSFKTSNVFKVKTKLTVSKHSNQLFPSTKLRTGLGVYMNVSSIVLSLKISVNHEL